MSGALAILPEEAISSVQPSDSGRVIGIDLGTTNSSVAQIVWQTPVNEIPAVRCLPIAQPTEMAPYTHILVPSVVSISDSTPLVGEGAKRLRAKAPERGLKQNKSIFWECKNDMGLRRRYHLAPEGYQSPPEIAAKVLKFIKEAADRADPTPISRAIVTVPASFQTAQRTDTIEAARLAGIELKNGDLLDEPVAAFLDYIVSYPERIGERLHSKANLVVFDFGGGTCDVAVLELEPHDTGINFSSRAVSRFHRLGGGDIDRAIVYHVLIPQLCKENGLTLHDLDFDSKRLHLEPSLLSLAEALKLQLCQKISDLKAFGRWDASARQSTFVEHAAPQQIPVAGRTLTLSEPRLTAEGFAKVLEPFLDRDLLCARESEYCLTNSIFAPLQDALNRAGFDKSVVSLVLMVGGSSLIPDVQEAVSAYFSKAAFLTYDDSERLQTSVARGAALHAFTLQLYGKPLFQAVAHDSISIRTRSGLQDLVKKGEILITAEDDVWRIFDGLAIPTTKLTDETILRLELAVGERPLFTDLWHIPPPVSAGEKLRLEYRFTQNQVFEFRLALLDQPEKETTYEVENPLTHVLNPQSVRLEIEEIEEQMRERQVPQNEMPKRAVDLAEKYAKLGQYEKAISWLEKAQLMFGRADERILNLLGIYCGRIGNHPREIKFYREAARCSNWNGPLFNLALSQKNRGDFEGAQKTVEEMEGRPMDGPELTLKAMVRDGLKISEGREELISRALAQFPPVHAQSEWQFDWYRAAASLRRDPQLDSLIAKERQRRLQAGEQLPPQGELPMVTASPALRP